jgi:hypothetical protein
MNIDNDNDFVPTVIGTLSAIVTLCGFFAMGYSVGEKSGTGTGRVEGKNEGIVFCVEKPQDCKISYQYLKLQENQK